MNTRRCELCGTLYGNKGGSVTIGVPREDVKYTMHDNYSLCEACALKVYDTIESLKTSDGKNPENKSTLIDLVQRQNAELARMKMCLRHANNDLYGALKIGNDDAETKERLVNGVNSAIEWIAKAEPYEED